MSTKIAIILPTYRRSDGKTYDYLTLCLTSIKIQTHQNFKVFLIGDKYEDQSEFDYFAKSFLDPEQIAAVNLQYAFERDRYPIDSLELWCSGGVHATNVGIDIAVGHGFEYICKIDHDDYWEPDHLEQINSVIEQKQNPAFIHTCSTYGTNVLPYNTIFDSDLVVEAFPIPGNIAHSSVCYSIKQLPFLYEDTFARLGLHQPADAYMWEKMYEHMVENNLKSYFVRKVTCHHPYEYIYNR